MKHRHNIFLNTDSYKTSHFRQYPPNTQYISSYIESRGGRWNRSVFFGLQMFLKEYLCRQFTMEDVLFAEAFWHRRGMPFYTEGAKYIIEELGGKLPIQIQAAPEGVVIETGNVLVQVINTDPTCWWLTSFVEKALLRAVWYPMAVATNSFMCKRIIWNSLLDTADNPDAEIEFKLHDFGGRGVSSWESAELGGCAHLVNFSGSDTPEGTLAAEEYYGEEWGGSIPATEHSTITSWGVEGELEAYKNFLTVFGGDGKVIACVSDSYDIWNAIENLWTQLKDQIFDSGTTLVIRPDSGNPVVVVPEVIERLMSRFGWNYNSRGYRVLHPQIRVIQGDGVEESSINDILIELKFRRISTTNIAFGMGGALLQHMTRDTQRVAMKACERIDLVGTRIPIFKNPITDPGKQSKKGRQALIRVNPFEEGRRGEGYYKTIPEQDLGPDQMNQLLLVFSNGELLVDHSFSSIRERTRSYLQD